MLKKMMANLAAAALMLTALGARAQSGDPLDQVATYDFGKSRAPLAQIEEMSRQADQKAKIEEAMIKVLQDPKATFAGKQFACRMLRLVGTEKSVPALAALLSDEKLSHMARWAMQLMPYPAVDEAFAKALDSQKGSTLVGVITSMGARKDAKSIAKLAQLAAGADAPVAQAAIATLGQIGGAQAAEALSSLKPADPKAEALVADARLLAADQLLKDGKAEEAQAIYAKLYEAQNPVVKVSALRGLVRSQKAAALPTLLAALKDAAQPRLAAAACKFYNEIPGEEATRALCQTLPQLDPKIQVMAVTTLMNRGDKTAAEAVAAQLASANEDVQVAAAKALAVIGGPAQVEPLVKTAVLTGAAGDASLEALGLIHGEGVAAAVRAQVAAAEPKLREKAIAAVEVRRDAEAVEALVKATQDSDRRVKMAAAKALGAVAGEQDVTKLADLLVASKSENERSSLEKALVSIAARLKDKNAAAETIVAKMAAADNGAKGNLMAVLAGLAGPKAFDAISAQLKSSDVALKKAAIRAFATWPEKQPAPMLLEVAKSDADAACKVMALRGFVDVVAQAPDCSASEKVDMLKEAMAIAKQNDDKTKILSGLAKVADPAALKMVEPCLSDAELGSAAQLAYIQIASAMKNKKAATAAIEQVLAVAKDDNVRKQAQAAMGKINKGAKPAANAAKGGKGKGRGKNGKKRQAQ